MGSAELTDAVASVPPGGWAVGVSGGADSVAMLSLLRARQGLSLHVAHLDHEARGQASAGDAAFVAALAARWGLPCTVARWRDVERELPAGARVNNPSARYRAGRLALFRRVVAAHGLRGVLLAHHADDDAETVFHRLLRGSGPRGLAGMSERSTLGGLLVVRPVLRVRRRRLREHLAACGQAWREDESNDGDEYLRNRLRRVIAVRPALADGLLALAGACRGLGEWVGANVPDVAGAERLPADTLRGLPLPLGREAARRWLAGRNVHPGELGPEVLDRLVEMAADAASPPRRHFPGGVLVRRRAGVLFVDRRGSCDAPAQ